MRSGTREGIEPVCPFCRTGLDRPMTVSVNTAESYEGGTCRSCGALYVVDRTGKNVGEVMMQALGIIAAKIGKELSEMVAGEDYDDAILSYNWRIHRSPGESKGYMDGYGRLYIVRTKAQ